MNKTDLVDLLAAENYSTKQYAEQFINSFISAIVSQVARGEKITLIGFGTFDTMVRKPRIGRNPKTGESVKIPARRVARFRVSKDFSDAVNKKRKKS
ncbi:MAG: HU family DNA-binding protein [Candidatus Obscuribacterales bacterium]